MHRGWVKQAKQAAQVAAWYQARFQRQGDVLLRERGGSTGSQRHTSNDRASKEQMQRRTKTPRVLDGCRRSRGSASEGGGTVYVTPIVSSSATQEWQAVEGPWMQTSEWNSHERSKVTTSSSTEWDQLGFHSQLTLFIFGSVVWLWPFRSL